MHTHTVSCTHTQTLTHSLTYSLTLTYSHTTTFSLCSVHTPHLTQTICNTSIFSYMVMSLHVHSYIAHSHTRLPNCELHCSLCTHSFSLPFIALNQMHWAQRGGAGTCH
eukprot:m.151270 g.151270  ORF g.151270 m.151270 type:complete len:109 (-) comp14247_c0_seq7:89-415(-)